jgi:fatty acid desaturase
MDEADMQENPQARLLSPDELMELQKSGPLKYVYLAFFPLMWAVGAYVNIKALSQPEAWIRYPLLVLGTLILALALNAFFLVLHEGCHHVLSRNGFVNRWGSMLYCVPLLMSFNAYRTIHLAHHGNLGGEGDPDNYDNFSGNPKTVLLLQVIRLTMGAFLYLFAIPCLSWKRQTRVQRREMVEEYVFFILVFAALFHFLPFDIMVVTVLLPLLPANFLINVRGLTQHTVTDSRDPFMASRSVRCHPLVTFLYMNENYHLEHHLFPSIPCDRLGELKRILETRWPKALIAPSYTWFVVRFFRALVKMDPSPIGVIERAENPWPLGNPDRMLATASESARG